MAAPRALTMLLVLVAIGAAAVTAFECPEINAEQTTGVGPPAPSVLLTHPVYPTKRVKR